MARFAGMKAVAKFLTQDERLRELIESLADEDEVTDAVVEEAAYEIAETWDYLVEKNGARWGVHKDDEALRQALSDWLADQLESFGVWGFEASYVKKKKIEYDAAVAVYELYRLV